MKTMNWKMKLRCAVRLAVRSYLNGDYALNKFATNWIKELIGK